MIAYTPNVYTMGLYYSQNDSTDKALACLVTSTSAAKNQRDFYTQSMALYQSSVIQRSYAPEIAIRNAQESISIYDKVKGGSLKNKAYFIMNLAECVAYSQHVGNIREAINITRKALCIALKSRDSSAIADVYQDLSLFHGVAGQTKSALSYAKMSWRYRLVKNCSAKVALAYAYLKSDSLIRAREIIQSIPDKDYSVNGGSLYSLRRLIAFKDGDYVSANKYADSTTVYLEKQNSSNLKTKDSYYRIMIQENNAIAETEKAKQTQTFLMISIVILVFIIFLFILHYARMSKDRLMLQLRHQQEKYSMEMNQKEQQLIMMRDFLKQKIGIIQKLNQLKAEDKKSIILDENDWKELEIFLNGSADGFVQRLNKNFPSLSKKDIYFLMLIKVGLPYSVIANAYNIEVKSVKQKLFLLKDKLGLKGSETSTQEFIKEF